MSRFSTPDDFMCGIYIISLESKVKADSFIKKYSDCPVWPIVTHSLSEDQVLVLALELKSQFHGDFSQESNTLVQNPHYLGAREIVFRRDDSLLKLLGEHRLETGYSDVIPCGANCEGCASFRNPCQGCPAYYVYEF